MYISKKIKISFISTLLLIIIAISASYVYGHPNADNISYESKYYFADQINEKIYIFFSLSNTSKANKYIGLLEERTNEYEKITNKEIREEFLKLFFKECKKARSFISKIKNQEEKNQVNKKIAEIIIDLLCADKSNNFDGESSSITDDLLQELRKTLNELPESIRKEVGESKKDKISSIDKGGMISDIIDDSDDDNDNGEKSDTGDENNDFVYFPIENIFRDTISRIITSDYQGEYTLKTVNVLANKGYFCANIALPDNFGALYLIRNTESGYVIDFIETDFDFSNITKPDSITDSEWQWLLYNADLSNEELIHYY